jgi:hypothetical protein
MCRIQGELSAAGKHHEQALALRRKLFGERHPAVASSFGNLGTVCLDQGDRPAALAHWSRAVQAFRQPGSPAMDLDRLQAGQLFITPGTVLVLRARARGLETSLGARPAVEQVRRCAGAYTLAADVLDRLRGEALQSEEARLQIAAEHSDLVVNRVRLAGKLFQLSADPADLAVAITASAPATCCVWATR